MRALGALLLVVGCSFEHGTLQSSPDAMTDARGEEGHADAPATTGACTSAGQRVCIDATHSGQCSASLTPVADRECPPGSSCGNGYCQPPAGATSCTKGSDCTAGKVCDVYVSGNSLVGYCTNPVVSAGSNTSCSTPGYDSNCVTGICAEDSGNHQRCLWPCENGNDSTCPGDWTCHLVSAPQTIEGVSTTGQYACLGSD